MSQWRLPLVLDVTSLDIDTLRELAEVFDKYADKTLRRILEQFMEILTAHTTTLK